MLGKIVLIASMLACLIAWAGFIIRIVDYMKNQRVTKTQLIYTLSGGGFVFFVTGSLVVGKTSLVHDIGSLAGVYIQLITVTGGLAGIILFIYLLKRILLGGTTVYKHYHDYMGFILLSTLLYIIAISFLVGRTEFKTLFK